MSFELEVLLQTTIKQGGTSLPASSHLANVFRNGRRAHRGRFSDPAESTAGRAPQPWMPLSSAFACECAPIGCEIVERPLPGCCPIRAHAAISQCRTRSRPSGRSRSLSREERALPIARSGEEKGRRRKVDNAGDAQFALHDLQAGDQSRAASRFFFISSFSSGSSFAFFFPPVSPSTTLWR